MAVAAPDGIKQSSKNCMHLNVGMAVAGSGINALLNWIAVSTHRQLKQNMSARTG